jgi:four helix bundle protein
MAHPRSCRELRVYQVAMEAAMDVFALTKAFPVEERYSLTDQIWRSSRSVCANTAEAFRKRRYPAHFASKLSDAESGAEETRVWIEFAFRCGYIEREVAANMDKTYDGILGQLVCMISEPDKWRV